MVGPPGGAFRGKGEREGSVCFSKGQLRGCMGVAWGLVRHIQEPTSLPGEGSEHLSGNGVCGVVHGRCVCGVMEVVIADGGAHARSAPD